MKIKLEASTEIIDLTKISNDEIDKMIEIACEFENYEMCAHLLKFKK